jgi:hypothetical protein
MLAVTGVVRASPAVGDAAVALATSGACDPCPSPETGIGLTDDGISMAGWFPWPQAARRTASKRRQAKRVLSIAVASDAEERGPD